MIKCPFCGTPQVANTIFCSECGVYLLDDERKRTESLKSNELDLDSEESNKAEGNALKKGSGPLAIRLKIGESKRLLEANLTKSIHLGRLDPVSDVFPEIDLTDDSALEKGVSRRHARIIKKDGVVVVEDLGSINGTFVNGKRLAPYLPEALNNNDQLQLGNLLIEVQMR